MEIFLQDLRLGFRRLRQSPGFTLVAILTLALGIGANTAIFSMVNSVLLRPLSYSRPQNLYLIREFIPQMAQAYTSVPANLPNFRRWQAEVHSFSRIAIAERSAMVLTGAGEPEELSGAMASANLFETLGVSPQIGRTFQPEEDAPGNDHEVILTDASWRARFHADPSIIGKPISLDGEPYVVVGVLPASFRFPKAEQLGPLTRFGARTEFFKPLGLDPQAFGPLGEFDFAAIARLKDGVTPQQALAELNVVQSEIVRDANQGVDLKAELWPLESQVVGAARSGLLFLLAGVGAVLLIACINVANLLLARVPGRMREAAIRTALGASRSRLVRQLLTESSLLAVAGGALGAAFAYAGLRVLVISAPVDLPRLDEVRMDARVLIFTCLVSVITGIVFGALPAWHLSHAEPLDAFKSGDPRTSENRRTRRVRESLIGFEVTLSTLLLIAGGLLTTSLVHVLNVDTGFSADRVLAADIALPPMAYVKAEQRQRFFDELTASLAAIPGVRSAGWVTKLPLTGEVSVSDILAPGQKIVGVPPLANYRMASFDYFTAFGIPLRAGRIYTEADRGRKVVVLSQKTADHLWPGENPIGKLCSTDWGGRAQQEVIGIVGDVRTVRLDAAAPMMVYVPDWAPVLKYFTTASLVLRTSAAPLSISADVRRVIHDADSTVPITALRPMADVVSNSVGARRFQVLLVMIFAGSALFLAALGIFGVVAYSVEQRRQELGIRMALGAHASDLWKLVLRQGMTPVVAGLICGVAAALAAGRLASALLFGITPRDPLTIAAVVAVVFSVGILACVIPAARTARLDPIRALRYE